MNSTYDVIVLGGGLAGQVAALTAKTPQNRVLLVTKGYGSFYYGPGVIDVLGRRCGKPVVQPWGQIDQLRVLHPYRILGEQRVRQAIDLFARHLGENGFPLLGGSQGKNLLLPTALGSIRPTYLAPLSIAQGEVRQEGDVKILGFEDFPYFSPQLVAAHLSQGLNRLGITKKVSWGTVKLGLGRQRPISSYDVALWLDHADHRRSFINELLSQLGREERIGFPAVLGLTQHREVVDRLEQELGKRVFEIPTIPPSVPGIRLHESLSGLLREKGVEMWTGYPVIGATIRRNYIQEVQVDVPGKTRSLQGNRFILATGGLGGEGLLSGPGWVKEPVFDLPVYFHPHVDKWSHRHLWKEQPYACFGLRVDSKMRPLDGEGNVCFTNLFAAGNILAFFDSTAEKSSSGIDIATGITAGRACREEVECGASA